MFLTMTSAILIDLNIVIGWQTVVAPDVNPNTA
jgi:hypothetical protein